MRAIVNGKLVDLPEGATIEDLRVSTLRGFPRCSD